MQHRLKVVGTHSDLGKTLFESGGLILGEGLLLRLHLLLALLLALLCLSCRPAHIAAPSRTTLCVWQRAAEGHRAYTRTSACVNAPEYTSRLDPPPADRPMRMGI